MGGSDMSFEMPKCKITVLKRILNKDLIDEFLENPESHPGVCEYLTEGQEFIVDKPWEPPEGFCAWAWADIRKDILTASGNGKMIGMKKPGVIISGCSDWFRPVIFKIEKLT
jgi:uncharacterized repeat protein (TIGR04076 family)